MKRSYFLDFWVKRGNIFRGVRGHIKIIEYGTIFISEIWTFSEMVPFLLRNLRQFLKWYHFLGEILAYSKMLPFKTPFFSHSRVQKGV